MVRIGVFSDTHVGRSVPKDIAELREKAFRHAFTKAIDVLISEKVDYVFHGGDIFEKRSMSPDDSLFVKEEFQRLIDGLGEDVRIFVVRGNHDGTIENSSLNYVEHPLAKYFKVVGDDVLKGNVELYEDNNIAVTGLGYTPYASIRLDEVKEKIRDAFSKSKAHYKVFILHAFVEGHQDIPPGVPEYQIINVENLKELGANLYICGHHHKYTPLHELSNVLLVTPGGSEAIDLSDESTHGICIIDLKKNPEAKFVIVEPLFRVKNVRITGGDVAKKPDWYSKFITDETKNYLTELESQQKKGVLRIVIEGVLDGDKYDFENNIYMQLREFKADRESLLHIALENRLREKGVYIETGESASRDEFFKDAFKCLQKNARVEAVKLVGEVDLALDEKASSKTGLLTDSNRRQFVERWLDLLGVQD